MASYYNPYINPYRNTYPPNAYRQNPYPQNAYPQNPYIQNTYPQNSYQQEPSGKKNNLVLGFIVFIVICIIIIITFFKKDGKLSEWGVWSSCSKTCGNGTQTRERKYTPPEFGGADDPDKNKLKETRNCNPQPCVIDGSMSEWTPTGDCLKSQTSTIKQNCGEGEQKYTRTYNPPQNGGIDVSSAEKIKLIEWRVCQAGNCPNQDGKMSTWARDLSDSNCYKRTAEGGDSQNPQKLVCGDGFYKEKRYYMPKTGTGIDLVTEADKAKTTRYNTISCSLSACASNPINAACTTWEDTQETKCDNGTWKIKQTRIYNPPQYNGDAIVDDCSPTNTTQWVTNGDGVCPSPGQFLTNFLTKSESNCIPTKGKDRKFNATANYQFAVGSGVDNDYITTNFSNVINDIKKINLNEQKTYTGSADNVSVTFKRTNNTRPEKFTLSKQIPCNNIPYHTKDNIQSYWKSYTKCTNDMNDNFLKDRIISSFDELAYIENIDTIKGKFANYTINSLSNTDNIERINECYGANYLVITSNRNKSTLLAGTEIDINTTSGGTQNIIILENNGWKVIFQDDGNLTLKDSNGYQYWATDSYGVRGSILRMQRDGNLVIYTKTYSSIWASNTWTANSDGAKYLELNSDGFLMLKKSNDNIIKMLYPTSHIILGGQNYRFINNNSIANCKTNWTWVDQYGKKIGGPYNRVTRNSETYPWCATADGSNGNKDRAPAELVKIHDVENIIHIVLMDKDGRRIYIEPIVFENIIKDRLIGNGGDGSVNDCHGDNRSPGGSYKIDDNRFDSLVTSSKSMYQIFKDEPTEHRKPVYFDKNKGSWHNTDDMIADCTQYYNLYKDNRYESEKKYLIDDGFKVFDSQNPLNEKNWVRYDRGSGRWDRLWKVYYRTLDDYVAFLNNRATY